ncbi:MAG: hypothetical protein KatS3mg087_0726 [Patescibacteria group bacterium]|nr:MAG: hypothetical protein KatS3mg087_0726 [Patescibacteria group bacterium]
MELNRPEPDLRDVAPQSGSGESQVGRLLRVVSEQEQPSLTIRPYGGSDYSLLAVWMEDLAHFYDGHSEDNKLLDQLVGRETGDRTGFFTKNKLMFMCDVNGVPAGMICINNKRGGASKIGPVIVNPDMRGKGVGKKLMETAEDYARRAGARKLYATTSHLNTPMNAIFTKHGFETEARFPDQYKKGSEELVWGLHLVPIDGQNNVNIVSVRLQNGSVGGGELRVGLFDSDNAGHQSFVSSVVELYRQWHGDLGEDFTEGMIAGHDRAVNGALSFQDKSKYVMVAQNGHGYEGMLTFTPKRGGPIKVYPVAGTYEAQIALLTAAEKLARGRGLHKLYTFAHIQDVGQRDLLRGFGFAERGVLQSPYKIGHDLVALDKFVK